MSVETEWLPVKDAAAYLGWHPNNFRAVAAADPSFPKPYVIGLGAGSKRYAKSELDAYVLKGRAA